MISYAWSSIISNQEVLLQFKQHLAEPQSILSIKAQFYSCLKIKLTELLYHPFTLLPGYMGPFSAYTGHTQRSDPLHNSTVPIHCSRRVTVWIRLVIHLVLFYAFLTQKDPSLYFLPCKSINSKKECKTDQLYLAEKLKFTIQKRQSLSSFPLCKMHKCICTFYVW